MANKIEREELAEVIAEVEEAQAQMLEGFRVIKEVVRRLDNPNLQAYLVDQLETLLSDDHLFIGRHKSIDDLLNDLRELASEEG